MINVLDNMDKCVGCASCAQRCPTGSITMKHDEEGFLFPYIQQPTCTDCGMCRKACPVWNKQPEKVLPETVYACWNKDDEIRFKSTSGALFTSLAESALKKGGTVFGAAFDSQFRVQHIGITCSADLDRLRGSKYVQSDILSSFAQAEALLRASKPVLFSGTPCQIAGLQSFLGKDYSDLLTVDLACHGVPSPKIWSMYLDYMTGKYQSEISHIAFRYKQDGWSKSSMKIDFADGKTYMDHVNRETYFMGFGKSIFNRKSCFQCGFKVQNTKADITLADFWGVEKLPGIDVSDNKGVSLLIPHTSKGNAALEEIREEIFLQERSFADGVKGNPRLVSSSPLPKARKSFFQSVERGYSFHELRKKYMDNFSFLYKMKVLAKSILGGNLTGSLNKLRKTKETNI